MSTPTPLTLKLCSRVSVTAKIENECLVLLYRGRPLTEFGDGLEIFLEGLDPASVELVDFVQDDQSWALTAITNDGSGTGVPWARGADRCSSSWAATKARVRVDVTATPSGNAELKKEKPLFIDVQPEGGRPWP